MVNFKGKRILSLIVISAVLMSMITFTMPVSAENDGTLLWSENFDGLTQGRDGWTARVGNYVSGTLTHYTVNGGSVTWEMAANNYTSKVAFTDGKLVLGQKRNTEHGSEVVDLQIPFSYNTTHPETGYTILEYDYCSNALPIRNRYNERSVGNDLVLTQKNGSGRVYGRIDVTSTNGIQDMLGVHIGNAADYTNIAAGTHKENIRTAEDISGKTVHMALIFDVANTQYNVAAKVDGEYSFLNWEWVDLPSDAHPQQFFDKITLTQSECNTGENAWTEVTYDNFTYTAYETLPEWAVAPQPEAPVVLSTTPANNATEIEITDDITVVFDQKMDDLSLDNIKLYKDSETGTEIPLTKTVAGNLKSVTFTPDAMEDSSDYYLVIPTSVKSQQNIALEEQVTVKFSTTFVEAIIPHIVSSSTVETGMGLTEPFKILFDTTMDFDSLKGVTLHKGNAEGATVALTPSMSTDKLAAYFAHVPLDYNTTYVLKIPNTVKSTTKGAFAGTTYTFKTISRTTQHKNVLWFEDFDARTGWNETEARAGWGVLLREKIDGSSKGYSGTSALGDRNNAGRAKVEFREGGLMFTRPQYGEDGAGQNYSNFTIPFIGYPGSESRYIAFEYDYYQNTDFASKYTGDITLKNSDNQVLFASNFGHYYYGYQYSTYNSLSPSSFTAYPEFYQLLSSYDATANGGNANDIVNAHELPRGSIANDTSIWVGKKMRIQVLFDVPNRKYIVNFTSDGTRYVARSGWQDVVPGRNIDFDSVVFSSACNSTSGYPDVITKIDNVAIVEYAAPDIASTSVDALTNIEIDEPVAITFTEALQEDTLSGITLKNGSTVVNDGFDLSSDGKTVTLLHDNLAYGTTYTLTVPTTVMSEDYFTVAEQKVISFTTMAADTAPQVKDITIADGTQEVALDKTLSVTFTKPMSSTSLANVTLTADGNPVAIGVSMSDNDKTVTFTHADFDYGKTYVLTIPASVTDKNSNAFAGATYTFYSKTAPIPPAIVSSSITNGQTGVLVTSEFYFTFDKAMNVGSLDNITLTGEEGDIPLYVYTSNGNKTIKLDHGKLDNGTDYTLTIPTSVKAVNGLGVASDIVYTFTTADVVEGETLLYGQYFDSAIGGATETQAQYQDGNWNIYSKVEGTTDYSDANKVEFIDGKMVITKEQRITGTEAENSIYAILDLSTAASMPETGVVAIEYDIKYSKRPVATMWYTDTTVSTNMNGNSSYEITRLSFSTGSYGWKDKSVYNDVNKDLTITPNPWLEGKDIHVKLVYNLDERTYSMFYTVDGVTYQSPVGVAPFRDEISSTKIAKLMFSYTYRYSDDDPVTISIDNVEVKKLTKPVVDTVASSVVDGQAGVSATERIKVAFNANMNTNYFKDIKIYEGVVAPQNLVPTTSVVEDAKTCYVYLDKGLKYSTAYIIDVPSSVVSTNLIPIVTTDITFTTEAPVVGYEAEFVSVKNGSGVTVTDIRGLTTVKAEVKFTNEMCAQLKSPKLAIALCDSEGNIKSVSYRQTTLNVGAPQIATATFTSTTPFELGDYIKAFVLDGNTGAVMSQEVIYNQ